MARKTSPRLTHRCDHSGDRRALTSFPLLLVYLTSMTRSSQLHFPAIPKTSKAHAVYKPSVLVHCRCGMSTCYWVGTVMPANVCHYPWFWHPSPLIRSLRVLRTVEGEKPLASHPETSL